MCGIAGLVAPRLSGPERLSLVETMVERMRHRGPSGVALWDGEGVSLGLARLAIVAPNQPARVATDERNLVHAVVNGEVYNHAELLTQLRRRGHEVPDGPDTAVIPHLYEQHGADFPRHLEGMYAVALWDSETRRLVLARDRAGEKPLFVVEHERGFAFASELKALLALPWVSSDPDAPALSRYLVHGFFAGDDTGFAAIRQLPPAHVLEIGERGAHRTRYWRPWDALGEPTRPSSTAEAVGATRRMLAEAVKRRVPGEVPFGVLLSGGVDSSAIAALAAEVHPEHFPTFSLRLPDRGYDESAYARAVAERIGSRHHELTLDAAAGEAALETYASQMDQPLGDPSLIPTWAISKLAAEHVPVVLTGEGGDELFAGYPTYLGHRWARRASLIPPPLRAMLLAAFRRGRPKHHHVTLAHLGERFLESAASPPFERHVAWFGTAGPIEAHQLLSAPLSVDVPQGAPLAHLARLWTAIADSPAHDILRRPSLVAYQLLDFELYLSGDLLTKVDRATMAHGLESRAPFLAHPLIEMALSLPENWKLRGTAGKWVLKQAVRDVLPPAVRTRRKQGFSPPFSAWARGSLRPLVEARLSRENIARAGVLDPTATRAILDAHLSGRADRGRTLWALLSLQMWAEKWVAKSPADELAPAATRGAESLTRAGS
jgi:asparagine synthase (glutamine-hydrolysing)